MPLIPIDTDIHVYLARTREMGSSRGRRGLVLVPDRDSWNDFGNNFRAELVGFGETPLAERILMRLMFPGASRTSSLADGLIGERERVRLDRIDMPFVSILADSGAYRRLVEDLGFDDAFSALRVMHDAVAARLENVDEVTLALARRVDFGQSAMRDDETWVAWRQADRYLSPNRPPDVADAAVSFSAEVHLSGMRGDHRIDADFGAAFPIARRSLVLVGRNGSGKTRLFRSIIDGLRTNPPWEDAPRPGTGARFDPPPSFSRLIVFSSAASDPYPNAILPWEGIDYRFHRMAGLPSGAADELAFALVDCMRPDGEVMRRTRAAELLEEIIEPLGIRDDLHVEVRAGENDALPEPVDVDGRLYLPLFRAGGEQRRLQLQARIVPGVQPRILVGPLRTRDLSSGEQALLRFAAQAIASVRTGTMFMFDEPETHLHPNYVSTFMAMLDVLLEATSSIALIATHSAYVVREVPARRVRIILSDADDDATRIEPPAMQTFGASIDTISQFVFGDISSRHRHQEVLEEWLDDNPDVGVAEFREMFREDLTAEAMSFVAQFLADRERE